jgi:malate/lactate dehydrogenase
MKVSIIGAAGIVGSCTAFAIAIQGLADELVMIDLNRNLLASYVEEI